jgi:collagen type III alpha
MLKQNDKNGDGKLSKDEAPERMREHFDQIDKNGDGSLDAEELKGMMQNRPKQ